MIGELKRALGASLRIRVVVLTIAAFLVVAVPAFLSFSFIVDTTVTKLGTLFAEKQVLYDRYRGQGALLREIALAETLSRSPAVRDWSVDETDPAKKARGIAELEHYRKVFADKSYFFVADGSKNYYFNDAANGRAGNQLSYTLSPDNPRDGWYWSTVAKGEGCFINVDNDDVLRVTKVWMNCVVTEGNKVLGVVGTGIDLTAFIRDVVDVDQPGVEASFVTAEGAIQAHRDASQVDFHSLTKAMDERKTVFDLLDRPEDRAKLHTMMDEVTSDDPLVRSAFMQAGGKTMLVGVGYLHRIGWYNVTFMSVDSIIDKSLFLPIGLLLAVMMVCVALLLAVLFKKAVLDRLDRLEKAVVQVEQADYRLAEPDAGLDEIGRLSQAFSRMAARVDDHTSTLEAAVHARTQELEQLAFRDTLTGIANRRGFSEGFGAVQRRQAGDAPRLALLLIDLDRFKQINDAYGHAAGDTVIREMARRLETMIGDTDLAGRWGGDEFIILLSQCPPGQIEVLARALQQMICAAPVVLPDGTPLQISASVGACLAERGESLEHVVEMADTALYQAKRSGRNAVVTFDLGAEARRA